MALRGDFKLSTLFGTCDPATYIMWFQGQLAEKNYQQLKHSHVPKHSEDRRNTRINERKCNLQGERQQLPPPFPGSRIHSRSLHGCPYKSMNIQMDINKSMDLKTDIHKNIDAHSWIFMFHSNPL